MEEKEKEEFIFYLSKYNKAYRKKLLNRMIKSYKSSTRTKTKKYMEEKNIIFNKCLVCGDEYYVEIHHVDYEDPYLIIPLCLSCHRKQHSKNAVKIKPINLKEYKKNG